MLPTSYCIDGIEYPVTHNYDRAIHEAKKLYPYLGSGRHRSVYDLQDGWVLKLPYCATGVRANEEEFDAYTKMIAAGNVWGNYNPVYAQCSLLVFHGVLAVRMEKVEVDIYGRQDMTREYGWIASVDCGQVGWTKDGRLVAFDYSYS
jgi:hypothetical protein